MPRIEIACFECGQAMTFEDQVSRREECPKCGADVRVCKNCEFYDPKVYNECRETSADPVREKDRSTLCDFFRPNQAGKGGKNAKDQLMSAAEALFNTKKPSGD